MVLSSTDANSVTLIADNLLMQQHSDMNLFVITEYQIINMTYPEGGVIMVIKFKRKIMSEMMTTYLPSMLLMMITFATTFFKPLLIEAALGVNLTTMLVMTTIFISKMESLHLSPNVSTSVRIFGSAEVRHTTMGTLSGF